MARRRNSLFALRLGILAATFLFLSPLAVLAKYASIVIDAETGEVLHQVNAQARNHPASLTKMMTLYMIFEALDEGRLAFDQRIPVSWRAAGQAPSRLGLKKGDGISVYDAISALVTKSANDAAAAIAEALGGTERRFARTMTEKARELGMSKTTFRNASGLPNWRQLSTARDLATLARALFTDFPGYYHHFSTREFTFNGRTYKNHNRLLGRYDGTDGIKTGYIRASGFNIAASVERDGRRLIGVVMGARSPRSRDAHMIRLFERAFAKATNADNPSAQRARVKPQERAGAKTRTGGRKKIPPGLVPPRKPVIDKAALDGARQKTARMPKPTNAWAIQVGAFGRSAAAEFAVTQAAAKAPRLLGSAKVAVIPVKEDGVTIYRARLTGLSEERARRACSLLKRKRVSCLTVPPEGDAGLALATE
ncbi:MAG: D-alanyl-D-alanine carboxypeptidase family protein [Alphaproteobacteria bacterium]